MTEPRLCKACGTTIIQALGKTGFAAWVCSRRCLSWWGIHPGELRLSIRNCVHCGELIPGSRQVNAGYCSTSCEKLCSKISYIERNRERLTRACPVCSSEFTTPDSQQATCSGSCGQALRAIRAGKRPGQRRLCEVCGVEYRYTYSKQRTCGRTCGGVLQQGMKVRTTWPTCRVYFPHCTQCGEQFTARSSSATYCSKTCSYLVMKQRVIDRYHDDPEHRDKVLATAHARRADKLGLGSKQIALSYLCERDHWRCGICHKRIRAKRGPMRPSIDHIIPLSRGGTHELSNVQAAHYRCNLSKNASGVGDQLILFG